MPAKGQWKILILRIRRIVRFSTKLKEELTRTRRIPVKTKDLLMEMSRCLRVTVKYPRKTRINVRFIRCKKMVKYLWPSQLKRRSKSNLKEGVHLCPAKRKRTLLWIAALKDGTKSSYLLTPIRSITEGSCRSLSTSFKHRMS